jgi:hypothetical protein
MSAPAIVLSTVIANPGLTQLDYDDLTDVPEFEYDAYEHWMFDTGDSTGLTGRLSSRRVLTLQSAAPTYSAGFLTIGAIGNALISPLDDQDEWTLIATVKYPAAAGMIGGTLNDTTNGGSLLIAAGGTQEISSYVPGLTNVQINAPSTPSTGDWVSAGLCVASTGAEQRRTLVGLGLSENVTGEGAYVPGPNKVALGNADGAGIGAPYTTTTLAVFEAILFNRALTLAEMQAVRARSIIRGARRSMTVL